MSAGPEEREKAVAARAAAELVQDGMTVALGSGSTVALIARALGERGVRASFGAASPATAAVAATAGLALVDDPSPTRFDLALDGADQVAPDGWAIKGGGGAHTRERILIAAADRFVCVVHGAKLVDRLSLSVPLDDPASLAARLAATPGVVDHGLFGPDVVRELLVARDAQVELVRLV